MNEWQPIEIAPLDGTMVLLYTGERAKYAVAYWDNEDEDWVTDYREKGNIQYVVGATHWIPLPDPPQVKEVAPTRDYRPWEELGISELDYWSKSS